MALFASRTAKTLSGFLIVAALAVPSAVNAQGTAKIRVLSLVRDAMDAYSNLDLDGATAKLEEALGFAPDLDKPTLARVYVSYAIVWIGGFADNAKGQRDFSIALCLDETIGVDPLLSSPDIDLVFNMAKNSVPDSCPDLLSTIIVPGGGGTAPGEIVNPPVPSCGVHNPPGEQRQKYEVPLYIEMDPGMRPYVSKVLVKYALDGSGQYKEMQANPIGGGFGAQISCDEGQIRVYDPSSISYYIEGYNQAGAIVCGNASSQGPYVTVMNPDATVLPPLPGMAPPQECAPCPPWDPNCGSTLPQLGDPCTPGTGCAQGLVCGDAGICEEAGSEGPVSGPSKFYVNVGGGSGFGIMSQKIGFGKVDTVEDQDPTVYEFNQVTAEPSGAAWSSVGIRLALGFHITEKLSVEVTGRFDPMIATFEDVKSCKEALQDKYGDDWEDHVADAACTPYPTANDHPTADNADMSVALDDPLDEGGKEIKTSEKLVAWLVNARVKYRLLQKGGLHISVFGGVGYGKFKYRIVAGEDKYFPTPTGINVELGPQLAYYFNNNIGIVAEIPIDLVVLDGWAINFDVLLGLSFGF